MVFVIFNLNLRQECYLERPLLSLKSHSSYRILSVAKSSANRLYRSLPLPISCNRLRSGINGDELQFAFDTRRSSSSVEREEKTFHSPLSYNLYAEGK
jgi:hypothetical protein